MPNQIFYADSQKGFTLIELMVVITIMGLLTLAVSINLTSGRAARDTRLAVNKLVSDIRKVQSYTLSSRALPSGELAQFYLIKFNLSNTRSYKIQAIYNVSTAPKLVDVETVNFPPNININSLTVVRELNPITQNILNGCVLLAFAAPFGKTIFNDGCSVADSANPATLVPTDDYYAKIINFQNSVGCLSFPPYNPEICSASTDSKLGIFIKHTANAAIPAVMVNAVTGSVCPKAATWACQQSY